MTDEKETKNVSVSPYGESSSFIRSLIQQEPSVEEPLYTGPQEEMIKPEPKEEEPEAAPETIQEEAAASQDEEKREAEPAPEVKEEPFETKPEETQKAAQETPEEPKIDIVYDDDDAAKSLDEEDAKPQTEEADPENEPAEEEWEDDPDHPGQKRKKKKWVEKLYKGKPRVYHISTHGEDGKWQVRLANGEKAIRLFDTQAEGIDFARGLLKTMGGSIRVHSVHGAIRKAGW